VEEIVPLSTFNSDGRAICWLASIRWLRFWLAVLGIIFLLLASCEGFWRVRGFQPSITDSWQLWSKIRREANDTPQEVALAGASRIMLGLDPELLAENLNRPVHMLAIDGSNPLPVLYHLANDDDFRGNVICSIPPYWLAGGKTEGSKRPRKWLKSYEKQTLSSRLESRLVLALQYRLVFRYNGLSPQKLWKKWREGDDISPPYAPMRPDRFRQADYSKSDLNSLRESRIRRTRKMHSAVEFLKNDAFKQRIAAIESAVQRIRKRGGEVIFVRLPSCGEVFEIEEQTVPRKEYWDVLSRQLSSPTLYFKDYPELSGFTCMDGSHLDYSDARVFTDNLARIVLEKKLLVRIAH
jgi:hypothetical protein